MINRRKLLLGGVAGVASLFAVRLGLARPETAITTIIRRQLAYLTLSDADVESFARDLAATSKTSPGKMRLIAAMAPLYRLLPVGGGGPASIRYGEERIVSEFLMSSDFFINGSDVGKPVHYLGLYDPWKPGNACRQPFVNPSIDV